MLCVLYINIVINNVYKYNHAYLKSHHINSEKVKSKNEFVQVITDRSMLPFCPFLAICHSISRASSIQLINYLCSPEVLGKIDIFSHLNTQAKIYQNSFCRHEYNVASCNEKGFEM